MKQSIFDIMGNVFIMVLIGVLGLIGMVVTIVQEKIK